MLSMAGVVATAMAVLVAAHPPLKQSNVPTVPGPQSSSLPRGVVSVTSSPYHCDSTGQTDVTACLQRVIDDGFSNQTAVFFPPGRYAVSDTLTVTQHPTSTNDGGVNIVPNRFRANTLMGATTNLPDRPTIVLMDHSAGFDDDKQPKNVIKVTNPYAENINMNQVFRGINIEVGAGNSGAVGLYFHGAQGGATQDVTVNLTQSGYAGFGGGGGAGASHVNVVVVGGRYGIWFTRSEPGPLVAGATLINQSESAVWWSSQQTMVLVGAHLVQAPAATGPLIHIASSGSPLSLVDARLECAVDAKGTTSSNTSSSSHVLITEASVYMRNVYTSPTCGPLPGMSVRAATHAPRYHRHHTAAHVPRRADASTPPNTFPDRAAPIHWGWVREFAVGVDYPNRGAMAQMNVIVSNGRRIAHATVHNTTMVPVDSVPSGLQLVDVHTWVEATFRTWESGLATSAVNAMTMCGAVGDGIHDDHAALQTCLQNHPAVFLPKGYYRLSQTLLVPPNTTLLGLSQTLSVLMPVSVGFATSASDPQPVVRVAPGPGATLAFVGVVTWWHLANVYTMDWEASNGLWRSNYETRVQECVWLANYAAQQGPCRPSVPLTLAKTQIHGTGRFYNMVNDEDILMTDHAHYRHVLIDTGNNNNSNDNSVVMATHTHGGSTNPHPHPDGALTTTRPTATAPPTMVQPATGRVRLYMFNMEHAMSEANCQVAHSTGGVDIFSLKVEGSNVILWVSDSSDVHLFGMGGGADAFPNTSYYPHDFAPYAPTIVRMERTCPYKLINLANGGRGNEGSPIRPIGKFPLTPAIVTVYPWPAEEVPKIIASMWAPWPGYAVPPSQWRLVGEFDGPNVTVSMSEYNDKPVLYQRGYP
eukprot:m.134068 g.134068  ORF g.134068 m.134068 type:complete len:869 (-) comp11373_c0_seq7:124-2730(-)